MSAPLEAVRRALVHLEPSRLVQRAMRRLPFEGPFALVAFGKAAAAMTEGVLLARPDALASGIVVVPEGTRKIVAVTADSTGNGGGSNTPVLLYYVDNGAATGLADLTVSLVGTISADDELSLADIYAALS